MGKKVYVGMSGGVDSSVAALLLLQQGFEVVGINLLLTPDDETAGKNAEDVAKILNIQFKKIDLRSDFKEKVIDNFTSEYLNARTPNPCIVCNENIKFGKLLDIAMEQGADFLATGHYARVEKKGNRFLLKRNENKKDQSYFLHRLNQYQLSKVLFPVDMPKDQTRKIAKEYNLPVADLPDSQEICFVKDDDYARFIIEYMGKTIEQGDFIDNQGNIIGKHKGIINYTIGQRKGLGISFGTPMYVTKIDPQTGQITLGKNSELMRNSLIAQDVNYIAVDNFLKPVRARVKIRCQAPLVNATVIPLDEKTVQIDFDEPQRAITPGQSAVFYDDEDSVFGGGFIK